MQKMNLAEIPELDVEIAPNDGGADESGVHHPALIFVALACALAVG